MIVINVLSKFEWKDASMQAAEFHYMERLICHGDYVDQGNEYLNERSDP